MAIRMGMALVVLALMGMAAGVWADGIPVWPAGANPKTAAPINGFCDAQQAILDNAVLHPPMPEWDPLAYYLSPTTGDLNGTSYMIRDPLSFGLSGNGMVDCLIELKLIEEVLRDTSFNVNGLTHERVHAAWNADDARFAQDVGTYWILAGSLTPGVTAVAKGHMILGDGEAIFSEYGGVPPDYNRVDCTGSAGFVQGVMSLLGSVITNPYIDLNDYVRMPQYFSKEGDADGDGASNECEYWIYGQANYVANALNPLVRPACSECWMGPCLEFLNVSGGGWYKEGYPLHLAVEVDMYAYPVTFQWTKDGLSIPDATDATYDVEHLTLADTGSYVCQATDEYKGSKNMLESPPMVVTVFEAGSLPAGGFISLGLALCAIAGAGIRKTRKSESV